MRDLDGAIGAARQRVGKSEMHGMCQGLSRSTIGVPAFGRSASIAWELCRDRGWGVAVDDTTVIPAGSIVYYSSRVGYSGHDASVGHATFCVKTGTIDTAVVVSNDVGPHKEIGAVHPKWFKQHWHMGVRGYITRCPFGALPIEKKAAQSHPVPLAPDDPPVHLSALVPGGKGPDVVTLQEALIKNGFAIEAGATGNYKDQTIAAVTAAQVAQGFTGDDADGIAGRKTCLFLGLSPIDDRPSEAKDVPRELIADLVGVSGSDERSFWDQADSVAQDVANGNEPASG